MTSPVTAIDRASESAPALIECRDVVREFYLGGGLALQRKILRAVDGVSLQLHKGEVLAIVGESGSGKTTLARMMLGLSQPTGGEILFDGAPIASYDRRVLARRIQAVFQDPYASLNPRKTVGDIVALPLKIQALGDPPSRRARVQDMLDVVGLPRRLIHSYPSQLSGGQRQRVAIARALVTHPDIIICDEPTSALDVSVQAQILNLLQDLRERLSLTYVFVSHDLSVVQYIADRVAVMYLGRIVEFAPAQQLFAAPRHPYTQVLLASVPTPEPGLGIPEPNMRRGAPNPIQRPSGCCFHPRCTQVLPMCSEQEPAPTVTHGATVECHLYR